MKTFEKIIKIFFFILFLILSCFAVGNEEIYKCALSEFSKNTPGLKEVLSSSFEGAPFELEAALFAKKYMKEEIIGFGLNIEFICHGGQKNFGCLNNEIFELRSTEYDVVTQNFIFECKLCRAPDKFNNIDQFRKERKMLLFFKQLKEDLEQDLIDVDLSFRYRRKSKKKYSILTIIGELTNNQPVSFTSKWVTKNSMKDCRTQWIRIIDILANRSFLIMFKNCITQNLINVLTYEGFEYKDAINYKEMGFEEKREFDELCTMVNNLKICSA